MVVTKQRSVRAGEARGRATESAAGRSAGGVPERRHGVTPGAGRSPTEVDVGLAGRARLPPAWVGPTGRSVTGELPPPRSGSLSALWRDAGKGRIRVVAAAAYDVWILQDVAHHATPREGVM